MVGEASIGEETVKVCAGKTTSGPGTGATKELVTCGGGGGIVV